MVFDRVGHVPFGGSAVNEDLETVTHYQLRGGLRCVFGRPAFGIRRGGSRVEHERRAVWIELKCVEELIRCATIRLGGGEFRVPLLDAATQMLGKPEVGLDARVTVRVGRAILDRDAIGQQP